MSRVPLIERDGASGDTRAVLDQVHAAFGVTPQMFRATANSPAALKAMWGFFGALGGGALGPKLAEQIAVSVAERNACRYCLAAHTALGRKAGASADEMAAAQMGEANDPRTAAALRFALQLVDARGRVGAAEVQALRTAGFDDAQVVEVIAHVALNVFTNYINVALDVPVDFPAVQLARAA
jgi:uncharacterized peroxidase-related enzyme